MSPARPLPRPCSWVYFFFVFFSIIFFVYFLCKYVFILIPLKKYVHLQFAHLRPPDQITKKTWKIKLHLITYIIIINMIIIYIYIDLFNKKYHDS
jgi:ABC-type microcin C transport system permease subunit YejB